MISFRTAAIVSAIAFAIPYARADYKTMDYGPFLNSTYHVKGQHTYRGTAIGFGVPAGKSIVNATGGYVFDTELLRPAAWWTGGFVKLDGVVFSGGHGANPSPVGNVLLTTKATPGWAKDGDFKDVRENAPYGPLPRDWARFKGLYRSGDRVVFAYVVGPMNVLEHAEQETIDGVKVLSRTLNLSASPKPQTLVVADFEGAKGTVTNDQAEVTFGKDNVALARIQGVEGATLSFADGRILANLPATKEAAKVKISVWVGTEKAKGAAAVAKIGVPIDLGIYTKGGKARWNDAIVTQGVLGGNDAPKEPAKEDGKDAPKEKDKKDKKAKPSGQLQNAYVVDSITPPFKNAYDSWMRLGGFDFFKDGRAAVCTWSGDVWIVSGIDDKLDKVTWKRYASGIFQALGLKIVDDKVYVLSRDGITRLLDLNGDGEADFYECFNNDALVTANFHEFIFDLHTDPDGNFYFVKGGPVKPGGRGWDKIVPHHGCVFKLSKDGAKLDVVARGFRAPNGMGLGPSGEITTGDNEGTWMPMCPLNWVKPGGFYGVPDFAAAKGKKPTIRDNPICWMPKNVDNSNGGQVWIDSDKFGPLSGQLLHMSYGTSTLFAVLKEEAGGQMQGGVVPLIRFDSGVCRARFDKAKNQLFLTGLRGWQTNASKDAGFYRVRYTGKPLNLPVGLNVKKGEIVLTFSDPVDPSSASNVDSYRIDEWNYRWKEDYGSPHFKVSDPKKQGSDEVEVESATVSADGKTVTLKVPTVHPVMQMKITLNLKAADGAPIRSTIHNTINVVGNQRGEVHIGEYRIVERKE